MGVRDEHVIGALDVGVDGRRIGIDQDDRPSVGDLPTCGAELLQLDGATLGSGQGAVAVRLRRDLQRTAARRPYRRTKRKKSMSPTPPEAPSASITTFIT